MKHLLTAIIFSLLLGPGFSQADEAPQLKFSNLNSVQLELGGHGGFYSLNYERILTNGAKFKTLVQVGVSYYPPFTNVISLWLPVSLNGLYSLNKDFHLEAGVGHSFTHDNPTDGASLDNWSYTSPWGGFFTGRLGVRFQKPAVRFLLRAGAVALLEYNANPNVTATGQELHWLPGVGVGYCF